MAADADSSPSEELPRDWRRRLGGLRRGPRGEDQRGKSFYTRGAEAGELPERVGEGRLRFVTYNIHKGIGGLDRRYRLERIVEVLGRIDADVCFLQEVDEGVPRSRRQRQVDAIADELGLQHRLYGPNVRLREGHYGNAILSRFAFDHHENIDLTIAPKKRRAALHGRASLSLGRKRRRLWLFNAHLGLSGIERRMQLKYLLEWVRYRHPAEGTGVVVAHV